MSNTSKNSNKKQPIENAEDVIERFGGIRPMAQKLGSPATTVQGWKKRGIIPATRYDDILKAAAENEIRLDDLLQDAPEQIKEQTTSIQYSSSVTANENTQLSQESAERIMQEEIEKLQSEIEQNDTVSADPVTAEQEQPEQETGQQEATSDTLEHEENQQNIEDGEREIATSGDFGEDRYATTQQEQALSDDLDMTEINTKIENAQAMAEKNAFNKGLWINGGITALAVLALAFVLWPQSDKTQALEEQMNTRMESIENRVEGLEQSVQSVDDRQSFLQNLVPENLGERIEDLKQTAETAQSSLGEAIKRAETLSQNVIAENAGSLSERLEQLETHINDLTGSPSLETALSNFYALQSTLPGQDTLDEAMESLTGFSGQFADMSDIDFSNALDAARINDPALDEMFKDVPAQDLKAAALLVGLAQFRSSLSRDNVAFEDDLKLLNSLVGDDPEFMSKLEELSPHAQGGVLTPSGLSRELRSLTGEIVSSSLKGEDVSITERATARFNNIFSIEKDGELITGTDTQALITKAQNQLDRNDVQGAIETLRQLEGDAAQTAAPILDEASTTLLAEELKAVLGKHINNQAYGSGALADPGSLKDTAKDAVNAIKNGATGGSEFFHDEKTGIIITRPKSNFKDMKLPE